jgi:predicted amidophosphoribosyltransferase
VSENQAGSAGGEGKECSCPFCDAPAEKMYPFCKDCGKVLKHCKVCGKPVPPHRDICAECEA